MVVRLLVLWSTRGLLFGAIETPSYGLDWNVTPSWLWDEHLNGATVCRRKRLIPLFERARDEIVDIRASTLVSQVQTVLVLREFNSRADNIAKSAASRHWDPAIHPVCRLTRLWTVQRLVECDGDDVLV